MTDETKREKTVDEDTRNQILAAIARIDHQNDDHWTHNGNPSQKWIQSVTGNPDINHWDIQAVAGKLKREVVATAGPATPSFDMARMEAAIITMMLPATFRPRGFAATIDMIAGAIAKHEESMQGHVINLIKEIARNTPHMVASGNFEKEVDKILNVVIGKDSQYFQQFTPNVEDRKKAYERFQALVGKN